MRLERRFETPAAAALLVLLVIVAFSSGTEVAMLSVNRYRIRHRAQAGHGTARVLERLLQKPDDWLGANLFIAAPPACFPPPSRPSWRSAPATRTRCPSPRAAHDRGDRVLRAGAEDLRGGESGRGALHAAGVYRVLVLVARPALWLTNIRPTVFCACSVWCAPPSPRRP